MDYSEVSSESLDAGRTARSLGRPRVGRLRALAGFALATLVVALFLVTGAPAPAQYPGGGGGYPGGPCGSPGGATHCYAVSYSGGTAYSSYPAKNESYAASGSTYGDSAATGWFPSSGANTASCTGQITAQFTWVPSGPGDPAPASAVVTQNSTAGAQVGSNWATANCDDGLGDGQCSGAKYTAQGGSSFQVQCSPSATISGGASPSSPTNGSVSVSYTASAAPVDLTLNGTTPDSSGNLNILIGQGCTGELSAGPATLSDYHWDAGLDTFAYWSVAPDWSWGHAAYLSGSDWEAPSPHWYYNKDGTAVVNVTATASVGGQSIGTVTAQKTVTVWAPYYFFGNDTGEVDINPYSTGSWTLQATASPYSPRGMNWQGKVLTPDLFASSGYGLWHFVQLITPGRYKWLDGGGVNNCSENGNEGLDTTYPYDPVGGTYGPIGGWPADDTLQTSGDSPATGLDDTILRVNIDESFTDFMMYHPPGDGQWVPLHRFQWRWYADDTRPGASWGLWSGGQAGYVARSSSQRWYDHPFWTKREGVDVGSGW